MRKKGKVCVCFRDRRLSDQVEKCKCKCKKKFYSLTGQM